MVDYGRVINLSADAAQVFAGQITYGAGKATDGSCPVLQDYKVVFAESDDAVMFHFTEFF